MASQSCLVLQWPWQLTRKPAFQRSRPRSCSRSRFVWHARWQKRFGGAGLCFRMLRNLEPDGMPWKQQLLNLMVGFNFNSYHNFVHQLGLGLFCCYCERASASTVCWMLFLALRRVPVQGGDEAQHPDCIVSVFLPWPARFTFTFSSTFNYSPSGILFPCPEAARLRCCTSSPLWSISRIRTEGRDRRCMG